MRVDTAEWHDELGDRMPRTKKIPSPAPRALLIASSAILHYMHIC